MDHSTKSSQHVQFAEQGDNTPGHNADIQVQVLDQGLIKVHLGFLQVRHRYEIVFTFESAQSVENAFDLQTCGLPDHVQVIELRTVKPVTDCPSPPTSTLHSVTVHLYAYKEKLLKEKVCLQSKNQSTESLTFIFYGRVLGSGKGTPSLKQGIRCIGFESQDDDDNNDA